VNPFKPVKIMKKLCITLIVTAFLITSCSHEKEKVSEQPGVSIERYGTADFMINLDSYTSLFQRSIRYLDQGPDEEYLYFLNQNNNSVYRYHLGDSNYTHRIKFDIDGPLGVGTLDGFDVHGPDSLFLLARYNYILSMVTNPLDSNRQIQKYRLLDVNAEVDMTPYAFTEAPMLLDNGILNILAVPFFYLSTKSYYEAGTNLIRLNLNDSSMSKGNLYSDVYKKRFSSFFSNASFAMNNQRQFVVSLPADHDLYLYDSDFRLIRKSTSRSTIVPDIKEFKGDFNSSEEETMHRYQNPSYNSILYDSYRNVYYRLAGLPNEKALSSGDKARYASRSFAIIVYDADLKIIGELELQPFYAEAMSFVGRSGLYLAQFIGGKNGIEEDRIKYSCFQLVQNEE